MVRFDKGAVLTGPVSKSNDFGCGVCGLKQSKTQHSIIRLWRGLPRTNDPKKSGVAEWMCTGCFAKAFARGSLVLYYNDGTEPIPDELPPVDSELSETGEPESAFEVSW